MSARDRSDAVTTPPTRIWWTDHRSPKRPKSLEEVRPSSSRQIRPTRSDEAIGRQEQPVEVLRWEPGEHPQRGSLVLPQREPCLGKEARDGDDRRAEPSDPQVVGVADGNRLSGRQGVKTTGPDLVGARQHGDRVDG